MQPPSLPSSLLLPRAVDALAAWGCNLALAARLRTASPQPPRVALLLGSLALTALHLWWPTQRLLRSVDPLESPYRSRPWGSSLQQTLILGAAQALAAATKDGPVRRTVLLPLAMLAPLVVLDPLSAAVLAVASLLLQLSAMVTAAVEGKASESPVPSRSSLLAPLAALAWLAMAPGASARLADAMGISSSFSAPSSWPPDTGVWWYLMSEAFREYRLYFQLVLAAHPFLYLGPLAVRVADRERKLKLRLKLKEENQQHGRSSGGGGGGCSHHHHLRLRCLLAAAAIAHLYRARPQPPVLAGLLAANLASLPPPALAALRPRLLLLGAGAGVAAVLMPAMAHLWLRARAGNANYLYFQTLVWNAFLSLLLLEAVLALVRGEEEGEGDAAGKRQGEGKGRGERVARGSVESEIK